MTDHVRKAEDVEALRALLVRVEACTEHDYQLDEGVLRALGVETEGQYWWWGPYDGMKHFGAMPFITVSIDAAVAAVKRCLPGWSRESGVSGFGNPAWCRLWDPMRAPGADNTIRTDHNGGSEPLAIVSCLLRALIARAEAAGMDGGDRG